MFLLSRHLVYADKKVYLDESLQNILIVTKSRVQDGLLHKTGRHFCPKLIHDLDEVNEPKSLC